VGIVINSLAKFGIKNDNNLASDYGPFYQSQRKDIYHSVAAYLLEHGLAYPCFLTQEEMDETREKQKLMGVAIGIYGEYARDRDLTESEIIAHLDNGEVPSIRLYSNGNPENRIYFKDFVRGSISVPENNEDIVIIKSTDRLPTYHFAHLCDDHFMRITHVVRGEEYFGTLALHIQMFRMMGWQLPNYIHTATLDKIDEETGKQRKMSKRKDPENNVAFFLEQGWPTGAVVEYLGNILAPGYEEAKIKGQVKSFWDYELKPKKIPSSGSLFDMKKLEWWAKEYIATMTVPDLVKSVVDWANEYGDETHKKQIADVDYLTSVLSIERDNPKRIRKDFITWQQTLNEVSYFWDFLFNPNKEYEYNIDALREFLATFDVADDKDNWWNKIVAVAEKCGIKPGEVAMNLRVAMTGRTNTPDLYSLMQVLGGTRVIERVKNAI
jgi:glutamyl-tRNA synthetase